MRNANAQNRVVICGFVSQFALCDMAKRNATPSTSTGEFVTTPTPARNLLSPARQPCGFFVPHPVSTRGLKITFAPMFCPWHLSHRLPLVSRDLLARSRPGASPGDLGAFFSTHAHEIKEGERKAAGNRRENRRRGSLPWLPNAPEALPDRAGAGRHAGAKAPVRETSCPQSHAGGEG